MPRLGSRVRIPSPAPKFLRNNGLRLARSGGSCRAHLRGSTRAALFCRGITSRPSTRSAASWLIQCDVPSPKTTTIGFRNESVATTRNSSHAGSSARNSASAAGDQFDPDHFYTEIARVALPGLDLAFLPRRMAPSQAALSLPVLLHGSPESSSDHHQSRPYRDHNRYWVDQVVDEVGGLVGLQEEQRRSRNEP